MKLTIDVGNTAYKCALFEDDSPTEHHVFREAAVFVRFLESIPASTPVIVSFVTQHQDRINSALKRFKTLLIMGPHLEMPFINKYQSPQTLGADRMANVAAAARLFKGKNCVIIDLGTCLKFDVITQNGEYLGGSISPGLFMRFKALHTFTGKLPLLNYTPEPDLIGKSTAGSIQSGVINGIRAEANAFMEDYKHRLNNPIFLLTGGDAELLAKGLKNHIFADPLLTLKGLNEILKTNVR